MKPIKKLLREGLLSEKLTDVDDDVNLLYDRYFKSIIDRINETGMIHTGMFERLRTYTSTLTSPEAIEAHKLNPCKILINGSGNYYKPSTNEISLQVNNNAVNFVLENGGNLQEAANELSGSQARLILKEFTEEKIKGSIHHELAHWIDDTINNRHISKMLVNRKANRKANELGNVNATKMEIQGQIHNIKQLYNKYKHAWDTISFPELIHMSPTLNNVHYQLKGDDRTKWIRDIKTRMNREGLLGKNMINN